MSDPTLDILLVSGEIGLVFLVILTLAAYLVFAERRILAWIQDRKGPNRVGPQGLLQPLAESGGRFREPAHYLSELDDGTTRRRYLQLTTLPDFPASAETEMIAMNLIGGDRREQGRIP